MAVTAAPARPATELRDRVVKRAEVVGRLGGGLRLRTAHEHGLGGRAARRRPSTATSTRRSRVTATTWTPSPSNASPHQRGTAYVRLVCAVSIRPARLHPTLAARTMRGIARGADARPGPRPGDLRAANRRRRRPRSPARRNRARTASRSPFTSDAGCGCRAACTTSRFGGLGRHPERVALALHDQHGHRHRLELGQPRLLRPPGRVQREREAEDARRAGRLRRPAGHARA